MIAGDVVDVKLKGDPVWRRNVTVTKVDQKGLWYTKDSYFDWNKIKQVEVTTEKPDFDEGTAVTKNGDRYLKYQNKWWKETALKDDELTNVTNVVKNAIGVL
jgi:hypothetical protein